MPPEFVNRRQELDRLLLLIQGAPSEKSLALLDSPAGMGKTELLIQVCRELLQHAHTRQEEWKIVRLDFRDSYPRKFIDRRDVLEEIARQICRDLRWSSIRNLIQQATPDDHVLIQQAAMIPLKDESRQSLLRAVSSIRQDDLGKIGDLIVKAFDDVDVQELQRMKDFGDPKQQVLVLAGFILDRKSNPEQFAIPDSILLVLDGLDAIRDEAMRNWVISELIPVLHDRLHQVLRFFVIVSGRFIEQGLPFAVRGRYHTIYLSPFTLDAVEDLIRQFGDSQFNSRPVRVHRLSRKLSQVCGGHPKVIKETVVQLYDRPGHFMALATDPLKRGYWYDNSTIIDSLKSRRTDAINSIVGRISDQQRLSLELLSVFRQFDSVTLEILLSRIESCTNSPRALRQYVGFFQGDVRELFDSLRETRLISEGGIEPFYSDRIVLRLMAAQMQEQTPDLFCLLNSWAVEIFQDWMKGKFPNDPESLCPRIGGHQRICVCEWLFHRLHLAERCSTITDALQVSQQISQELGKVLQGVLSFPDEPPTRQRERIKDYVERNQQIDHLIWEVALEDEGRYREIRARILNTF